MDESTSRYWLNALRRPVSRRGMLRGAGIAGAGLAGAALIGCGGSDTTPATATKAPAGAAATSATGGAVASAGKPGGRLHVVSAGDPPSLDLHQESTSFTNYATSLAYNQIVKMDPLVGAETPKSVVADLASSWEVSPDGQTYVFHLVQNAKFHDGTPFTSADVKASLERQKNPPKDLILPPRQGQLDPIKTIETPDNFTVTLKLGRPVSALSLLPVLAQGWMAIYSKKDVDGGFDFKKKVNGTGPYLLKSYDRGNRLTYDKNPGYFVKDRPYLDGVDVFIVPDTSTTLANVQSGQLDVYGANLKDFTSLQTALGEKANFQSVPAYGFSTMNFGQRKPWDDVRVRRAVTMAINKDDFIKVIQFGDGGAGGYMSRGGFWSISDDELQKVPGYEKQTDQTIAEARKLLDAAGVANGFQTTILTRQGAGFEPFSLFIQDQLNKVGIKTKNDIQETAIAYDNLQKRNFDLGPWVHGYAVDDPDAVFAEFYITGAPRNYSQLSSPEIDDLFLKQSAEQDLQKRQPLVKQLQTTAMAQYSKVIAGWSTGHTVSWKKVQNFTPHGSPYNSNRWQDTWFSS